MWHGVFSEYCEVSQDFVDISISTGLRVAVSEAQEALEQLHHGLLRPLGPRAAGGPRHGPLHPALRGANEDVAQHSAEMQQVRVLACEFPGFETTPRKL